MLSYSTNNSNYELEFRHLRPVLYSLLMSHVKYLKSETHSIMYFSTTIFELIIFFPSSL
jgi:hypothetical protein